jgi:hypothetical protein
MRTSRVRPPMADRNAKEEQATVYDLGAYRARRAFVTPLEKLPAKRRALGAKKWKADKAGKGTWNPGGVALRALASDAELLAQSGASHADVLLLLVEAALPAFRAIEARDPVPPMWIAHEDETLTEGEATSMVTRYLRTGLASDRQAAFSATMRHIVAALNVAIRLQQDDVADVLREDRPLPPHVVAILREVLAADAPRGA